jgi:hypothetical protein
MNDLRDALLAGSVRAQHEHRHVGVGDRHREAHDRVHLVARVDQAREVHPAGKLLAVARSPRQHPPALLLLGATREPHADRREQASVVPRLRDVVGGPVLHELHGSLERRPRGHEHHGHLGVELPDRAEQLDPLATRGRVARVVHVLHHDADVVAGDDLQSLAGVAATAQGTSWTSRSSEIAVRTAGWSSTTRAFHVVMAIQVPFGRLALMVAPSEGRAEVLPSGTGHVPRSPDRTTPPRRRRAAKSRGRSFSVASRRSSRGHAPWACTFSSATRQPRLWWDHVPGSARRACARRTSR